MFPTDFWRGRSWWTCQLLHANEGSWASRQWLSWQYSESIVKNESMAWLWLLLFTSEEWQQIQETESCAGCRHESPETYSLLQNALGRKNWLYCHSQCPGGKPRQKEIHRFAQDHLACLWQSQVQTQSYTVMPSPYLHLLLSEQIDATTSLPSESHCSRHFEDFCLVLVLSVQVKVTTNVLVGLHCWDNTWDAMASVTKSPLQTCTAKTEGLFNCFGQVGRWDTNLWL